jgi:hypothetical protein
VRVTQSFELAQIFLSRLTPYVDEIIGIIIMDFDTSDHLLIKYCDSSDTGVNVEVRRETLYSILTEFSVPMKIVMLIKMSSNETYSPYR